METSQFKRVLVQTLENYQRCGITRFAKWNADQIPDGWLESIEAMVADSTSQRQLLIGPAEQAEKQVNTSSALESRETPFSAPRQLSPGSAGSWQLPMLQDPQRRQRFELLDADVKACRECVKIVGFRQQTVFGVGPLRPKVCFVGEAPGADEDRQGEPFVGRAGQLLNKIIHAMTLKREEVYILNALKCRPPQNRTPLPEEIDNCRHFVETQLEVLQPQYLVCLGAVAVRSILQLTDSIGRLRGKWHTYRGAQVVVTYHPSYLLRNESAKRLVWEDMKMLMRELGLKP